MSRGPAGPRARSFEQARATLRGRLESRRPELEQAILTRVYGISDPSSTADPGYLDGLRAAVRAAIEYGLEGLELGERRPPPVPDVLRTQARVAARNGVSLDTVLRRYFAGYTLLGDFLIEEAERGTLQGFDLKPALRAQATLLDRLLAAVSEEYGRERSGRLETSERHRAERVRRLLAGELLDSAELAYDFAGFHLGALATGPGAAEGLRALAASLDRRLLLVHSDQATAWAWLGGRRRPDLGELGPRLSSSWPAEAVLALGEPAEGLDGWRLSHRQAKAALPVALRREQRVVRYADVALLASALQDDLLTTSLRCLYLAPLRRERDGGEAARETLRAYFAATGNVSSAATALGVSRRTVTSRLRAVEELLGHSLDRVSAEIETAPKTPAPHTPARLASPAKKKATRSNSRPTSPKN